MALLDGELVAVIGCEDLTHAIIDHPDVVVALGELGTEELSLRAAVVLGDACLETAECFLHILPLLQVK